MRQDYHGNKHHFREHLIPESPEGLDIGLTGWRFRVGRFRDLISDTVTTLTAVVTDLTVTTLTVASTIVTMTVGALTVSTAATLSFLGAGYVKTDSSGVVSAQSVPIPLADGGTGATTLAAGYIKSNGTVFSSQAVPIPVADGGTNAITAAAARTSLGVAPLDPSFVTLGTNSELSNERVLTAGTGITLTDAGAGSTLTIAVTGGFSNPIATQVFGG